SMLQLWQGEEGIDERLARLIPPERARLYSISSVEQDAADAPPRTIELTVGQLRYSADPARLTMPPPGTRTVDTASGRRDTPNHSVCCRHRRRSLSRVHPRTRQSQRPGHVLALLVVACPRGVPARFGVQSSRRGGLSASEHGLHSRRR